VNKNNKKKNGKNKGRDTFSDDDDNVLKQRNKHLNKTKRGNKNFED